MKELEQWIKQNYQIEFIHLAYLQEAMTHSSYSNEHKELKGIDNERMEFLGDAVLELFISQWLYRNLPGAPEGQLTKLRAQIVCEESLATMAVECRLDQFVLLGKGEKNMGGQTRPALLCDLFEAFIGALYLDKGFDEAARFLTMVVISKVKDGRFQLSNDYKTELQEFLQQNGDVKIQYVLMNEIGPSHAKDFSVEVQVNGQTVGCGSGKTKKAAEQLAAKEALKKYQVLERKD